DARQRPDAVGAELLERLEVGLDAGAAGRLGPGDDVGERRRVGAVLRQGSPRHEQGGRSRPPGGAGRGGRTSRSVRRVLFPRAVTPARATVIHLGRALPHASSGLPDCASPWRIGRAALRHSLSDLAPGGVYRAGPVTRPAGGLLHHRFTLTARAGPEPVLRGGLFSVALSRGSPRVRVTHHLPLRSPDVPRRGARGLSTRPSDRLVRTGKITAPGRLVGPATGPPGGCCP